MPRKRKNKPEIIVQLDNRFRLNGRIIFTLLLIFAGALSIALTYALITEARHQISVTREVIQEQRDANISLRAQITEKYSIDEIERIAVDRLGMIKPDPSQIIRIYVPKQNYSELQSRQEPETESIWQTVISFFQNLIKIK
jgi:cell division protein FtsL